MDLYEFWPYRPYAYDVRKGRPHVLGVKRGTATCAIAKHAASGPTPAWHTAGPARARALTERLRAPTLFQHNTCAQRDKSWPPTWRRCYGDMTSMHKVYCSKVRGLGGLQNVNLRNPHSYLSSKHWGCDSNIIKTSKTRGWRKKKSLKIKNSL